MAFAMAVPIAVFDDGDVSTADSDPDPEPDFMEILMQIGSMFMTEEALPAETQEVHADIIVGAGEMFVLDKNYVFDEGKKIVIQEDAYLIVYPMQSFGFSSTTGFAAISVEEDAALVIVSELPDAVTDIDDVAIYESVAEDDDVVYFSGSLSYELSKTGSLISMMQGNPFIVNFGFEISKGFTVKDDLENPFSVITFNDDSYLDIGVEIKLSADEGSDNVAGNATLDIDFAMDATVQQYPEKDKVYTLNIGADADLSVEAYSDNVIDLMAESGSLEVSVDGDLSVDIEAIDAEGNSVPLGIDADIGIDAEVTDLYVLFDEIATNDEAYQVDLSGDVSFDFDLGDFSDITLGEAVATVKGFDLGGSISFDDLSAIVEAHAGFDRIYASPDPTDPEYDGTYFEFSDVEVSVAYGFDFIPEDFDFEMPLTGEPSPADIFEMLAAQYLSGAKDIKAEDWNADKYAGDFFLDMIDDEATPLSSMGIKSTLISVSASVGEIDVNLVGDMVMEGSDLSINASVDREDGLILVYETGYLFMTPYSGGEDVSGIYLAEDLYFSVVNAEAQDSFLTANASGSVEAFIYGDDYVIADIFIDGFGADLTFKDKLTPIFDYVGYDEFYVEYVGMVIESTSSDFDAETHTFTVGDIEVSGTYAAPGSFLASTDGEIGDITVVLDLYNNVKPKPIIYDFDLELTDVFGNVMFMKQSYDSETKTLTRDFGSDGIFWPEVAMDSPVVMMLGLSAPTDVNSIVYNYSGQLVFEIFDFTPVSGTPSETKNGTVGVSATAVDGRYIGPGELSFDSTTVDVDFIGCFLLATKTAEGMTYKAVALPGYTLEGTPEMANITLTKATDGTFDVTITDLEETVKLYAVAETYNIYIDDKLIMDNAHIAEMVNYPVASDVIMLINENGGIIGDVYDSQWHYVRHIGTDDLRLTTVTATPITDVKAGENSVTSESVSFTMPDLGAQKPIFVFENAGRVAFTGSASVGTPVSVTFQATKYDGHNGFLVKVLNSGEALASEIYVPVKNADSVLKHVDQYGRVITLPSTPVTIGEQTYLKVAMSDYSIVYAEDFEPHIEPSSHKDSNIVIYAAIAAAIIAVAAIGAFVVLRGKSA
ncbi:MAG: hypothetical protein E7Z63_03295 [Thermoplasmata archaeon]|nr:hypothetical protein [Thermoplasmata archaeon]